MTRIVTSAEYRRARLATAAAWLLTFGLVALGAAADLGGWFV